jgi:LysM repeat protein
MTTGNQCSKRYTVASGDYCSKIETTVGLTDAQLRSYNSWIDSACDLQVGQVLCVGPPSTSTTSTTTTKATTTSPTSTPTGPPSNLASGSFTNCTSYHTVVSGDTCNSMETSASISATDLLRWNPEVNVVTCTNIQLGAAYCVGGGG